MRKVSALVTLCATIGLLQIFANADQLNGDLSPEYEQIEEWLQGCGAKKYSDLMDKAREHFELSGESMEENLRTAWKQILALPEVECNEEGDRILRVNARDAGFNPLDRVWTRVGQLVKLYTQKSVSFCSESIKQEFKEAMRGSVKVHDKLVRFATASNQIRDLIQYPIFGEINEAKSMIQSTSNEDFIAQLGDYIVCHRGEFQALMPVQTSKYIFGKKLVIDEKAIRDTIDNLVESCKAYDAVVGGVLDRFEKNFNTPTTQYVHYPELAEGIAAREFCNRFLRIDQTEASRELKDKLMRHHPSSSKCKKTNRVP